MAADIPIHRTIHVGENAAAARERYLGYFTGWMGQGGFQAQVTPEVVSFVRRSFNTWQIVVAILLFPIGLLALLAEKKEHRLDAYFQAGGEDEAAITLTGSVPPNVSNQLADRIDVFDPAMQNVGDGRLGTRGTNP